MENSHIDKLKDLMNSKKLKMAVAESLTTGNIQAAIGSISGASTFFEGGMTVYNLEQKSRFLGVNREHAEKVNSVSSRVATEMAKGVCLKFECDIGIGTTGYAEPHAEENIASPCAYFAIWRKHLGTDEGEIVDNQLVIGEGLSRVGMQIYVTKTVISTLIEYLKGLPLTKQ